MTRESKEVSVLWLHFLQGLTKVVVDFGDLSGEGKHFVIEMEINVSAPPKEGTAADVLHWGQMAERQIRGDVMTVLSYPVGVILSNYMLTIHETDPTRFSDFTSTTATARFTGQELFDEFKRIECLPGLRRTNWPA